MGSDLSALLQGVETLLSDTVLGHPWTQALNELASAAGGHSASLWRSYEGRPAFLGSTGFIDGMRNFARPGDPPYDEACMIATARARGFVSDAEPETQARLKHVAFYQDVMVRYDFPWRAAVHLDGLDSPGGVHLLFWRDKDEGPYLPEDLRDLERITAACRLAAIFARDSLEGLAVRDAEPFERRGEAVFRIDPRGIVKAMNAAAEASVGNRGLAARGAEPFERRGEAVFRIDPRGFVKAMNAAAEASVGHRGLAIIDGRLSSLRALERHRIDVAVGAAISEKAVPGSVLLAGKAGSGRSLLVVLPVVGMALDVFGTTKALAVLIDLDRPYRVSPVTLTVLRDTFRLTEREAEVAVLIAQSRSPSEIARLFGSAEGTIRNHVKRAMQKIGVHSQVELANLIARLQ